VPKLFGRWQQRCGRSLSVVQQLVDVVVRQVIVWRTVSWNGKVVWRSRWTASGEQCVTTVSPTPKHESPAILSDLGKFYTPRALWSFHLYSSIEQIANSLNISISVAIVLALLLQTLAFLIPGIHSDPEDISSPCPN